MSDGAPPPWLVNMQRWVGAAHGVWLEHMHWVWLEHACRLDGAGIALLAYSEHELILCMWRPSPVSWPSHGSNLRQTVMYVRVCRYGPPPSYPSLKIPGLNAPIPPGAMFGYHPGARVRAEPGRAWQRLAVCAGGRSGRVPRAQLLHALRCAATLHSLPVPAW